MSAYLLVRAEVEENSREGFDNWYQNEHLPSALKEFEDSIGAWRAWSDVEDGIHLAFYEFEDLESIFSSYSKAETFKNWDPEILWSYIIGGTFQKPNGMYTLKCSPETEAVFYEENTPTYMFEDLSNIKCPTLLITSENQQRFPENSIPLQSIKNSASSFEHSVVTGVGHFIPQEKPEEFNELVSNFFNNI